MSIEFHILRANGALAGTVLSRLREVLDDTARNCSQILKLGDVDVVVMNAPWSVIPRIGINGFSYDAHQVTLLLDVKHRHLRENFQGTIRAILAHELHHSARAFARGNSHSTTYGGSLIAEGLACCFEEEIGEPTPFYAVECDGDVLRSFAMRAEKYVNSDRRDMPGTWQNWMFGDASGASEFPYQCGYSLGYALVKDWLLSRGLRSSDAVDVDENMILQPWLDREVDPFQHHV
jgi:hypothetical protein